MLIFPLRRDNNVVKSASVLFWRFVTMETNTTAYVKLDYANLSPVINFPLSNFNLLSYLLPVSHVAFYQTLT